MDWNTPDLNSWPAKLVIRVGKKLRSSKAYSNESVAKQNAKNAEKRRRRASHRPRTSQDARSQQDVNELGEREHSVFSDASTLVDHKDHTDMMHRLAHHDSFDSLLDQDAATLTKLRDPYFSLDAHDVNAVAISERHERMVASLPSDLWTLIASYLSAADVARLAYSTKILRDKLGSTPFEALRSPENKLELHDFLLHFDSRLPDHLLCYQCSTYHLRTQPRRESLKADFVENPLFACPNVNNSLLPRMRLTYGRELPYSFVQLGMRSHKHSAAHGIPHDSLSRHWKCRDSAWTHRTRYMIHDGHLLVRVVSQAFAPPKLTKTEERHLLYDREEYTPFFSVCPHWRDGELMKVCKCALSHVPSPPDPVLAQLKRAPKIDRRAIHPNFIVRPCNTCQPLRRCPECPTEYLIEIQMIEDKADAIHPFKHSIVVTRWSDLGDGSSPFTSPEWAAIKGQQSGLYESFTHVGRRAVSGIFESKISGSIPGQRMTSLNPKMEKLGEDGDKWY